MNRHEFMNQLSKGLRDLSENERLEILADYDEHFDVGLSRGMTEEAIATKLGRPENLARAFVVQTELKRHTEHSAQETGASKAGTFLRALLLVLMLAPFNVLLLIFPGSLILGLLVAGFCVSFALILSAAAGGLVIPFVAEFTQSGFWNFIMGTVGAIGIGVGILGLSFICAVLFGRWLVRYFKFSLNLVVNKGV